MTVFVQLLPEAELREVIGVLVRVVKTAGALIIFIGALWAFARFAAALLHSRGHTNGFNRIRLTLGRFPGTGTGVPACR
ncbi:hypothetical protein [Streptomyces sp. NPDC006270]|uniref:hypothetical protein n=1 Tax=Streptomyces sp. NPDC006270 TaxID=3364741 RepID=UPI00369863D0